MMVAVCTYDVVKPKNRLVARTLERAWEEKLQAQQQLEEEYHRFLPQQPRVLTAEEREAVRQLAADIPALWNAVTTTNTDHKEIIRQVVERVEVEAQGKTEQVQGRQRARWCVPLPAIRSGVITPAWVLACRN